MKNTSRSIPIDWYQIADAAKFLGVSQDTLRRWEKKGTLIPRRTAGGHRRYSKKQLERTLRAPTSRSIATKKQQFQRKTQDYYQSDTKHIPSSNKTTIIYKTQQKLLSKKNLIIIAILIITSLILFAGFLLYKSSLAQPTPPITPLPTSKSLMLP